MFASKSASVLILTLLFFWTSLTAERSAADSKKAIVGVATNFISTVEHLKVGFEKTHDGEVIIVAGSTGKLYAQISQGAPIDIFLSADKARPARLGNEELAMKSSQFTYAVGQLVAWFPEVSHVLADSSINQKETVELLKKSSRLAIANEMLAPYGAASVEFLRNLDLYDALKNRIVRGENIGQAFGLVSSGNADAGLIAFPQALHHPDTLRTGQYRIINPELHLPIHQDAVLLQRAADNAVALEFMEYLRSPAARKIIREAGYVAAD